MKKFTNLETGVLYFDLECKLSDLDDTFIVQKIFFDSEISNPFGMRGDYDKARVEVVSSDIYIELSATFETINYIKECISKNCRFNKESFYENKFIVKSISAGTNVSIHSLFNRITRFKGEALYCSFKKSFFKNKLDDHAFLLKDGKLSLVNINIQDLREGDHYGLSK